MDTVWYRNRSYDYLRLSTGWHSGAQGKGFPCVLPVSMWVSSECSVFLLLPKKHDSRWSANGKLFCHALWCVYSCLIPSVPSPGCRSPPDPYYKDLTKEPTTETLFRFRELLSLYNKQSSFQSVIGNITLQHNSKQNNYLNRDLIEVSGSRQVNNRF